MVKCSICDKEFSQLTRTHLNTHKMTMKEYRNMYPNSKLWSDELVKNHSEYASNSRDNTVYIGLKQSEETKLKKSKALTGIKRSKETIGIWSKQRKIFWNSDDGKKLASRIGSSKKPNGRYSESMKRRWRDPTSSLVLLKGLRKGLLSYNGINKPERAVLDILHTLYYDGMIDVYYLYNGTGDVGLICGYLPDFVGSNRMILIELYGCYYHGCKLCYFEDYVFWHGGTSYEAVVRDGKRKQLLVESGYHVLEIFEHELKDEYSLKNKIINFHKEEL